MSKIVSIGVLVSLLFLMPACKGSTTPTPPAVTVSSITVTSASTMLKVGQTETFTATANMSNGTQQAATGTWSSDATSVATVNASGLVTIVGAGTANIVMTQSGKTGSKGIRGVPDYQGTWTGTYRVDSCSATGDFALMDFCSYIPNGTVLNTNLVLTQTLDSVSGTFYLGDLSATATGPIASNGQLTLTGKVTGDITIDTIYTVQSTTPGQITGGLYQLWLGLGAGMSGNAQLNCTIVTLSRTSPMPNEAAFTRMPLMKNATLQDLLRAVTRR